MSHTAARRRSEHPLPDPQPPRPPDEPPDPMPPRPEPELPTAPAVHAR